MKRRSFHRRVIMVLMAGLLGLGDGYASDRPLTVTHLTNNEWTTEERQEFYHTSEGPWFIPYRWFEILESLDSSADGIKLFASPANVQRYGLILDASINPDGLPVGFVVSKEAVPRIGLTCAGCHTGQIEYRGQVIVIDGGAPIADMNRFSGEMFMALGLTLKDEAKFMRFAQRHFKKDHPSNEEMKALSDAIRLALNTMEKNDAPKEMRKEIYPSPWGYGRLDALGRGGNTLLGALSENNFWPASAPVSFPSLWGASDYLWVQWNGSVMQPMARNIAQAITGSRRMDYSDSRDRFRSDVDIVILHRMERLARKLKAPSWPQDKFDDKESNDAFAIDVMKASAGKKLFNELCVSCHVSQYSEPNRLGKRFLSLPIIPLDVIGTDPMHANNFAERVVDTGPLKRGKMKAVEFMELVTDEIRKRRYREQNVSETQYQEMDGFRENQWQACRKTKEGCSRGYVARPLASVWATPPFLHNGSVPNLYQLLSPAAERSSCFYLGHREFDPKHVGYTLKECDSSVRPDGNDDTTYYDDTGFRFYTGMPGNSNAGHEFNSSSKGKFQRVIREDERFALIEYLKTCDLEISRDREGWEKRKNDPPAICNESQTLTQKQ